MKITDGAKQLLESFLHEKGAEGIRLIATPGCCGPQFDISLDSPEESDKIETINGIQVAFNSTEGTEEITLDIEETENGAGLVLVGGGSSCC